MKSDTERKKYYTEKLHKRKSRLHVHLSKDLRTKLKVKKRSLLVHKGDTVRVMRGPGKGKEAKVSDVNTVRRKVFVEGIMVKNARGREVAVPLEPSNLLLLSLEATKERKEIFSDEAFKKKEAKKEPPKEEAKKEAAREEAKPEAKAEVKTATGLPPIEPTAPVPQPPEPGTQHPAPRAQGTEPRTPQAAGSSTVAQRTSEANPKNAQRR